MAALRKTITLPGRQDMPAVGLGTFTIFEPDPEGKLITAIKAAVNTGYRHIDCAIIYGNEADVGKALKDVFSAGKVKRSDIFITTKVWDTHHRRPNVRKCLETSLKDLQLSYVDLFLVHWPTSMKYGDELVPKDKDGNIILDDCDFLETWKGMEDCHDAKLTRNIGLCNFTIKQTQRILDNCKIRPCSMQVEVNILMSQEKLVSFCDEKNIKVTAFAPLGAPGRTWQETSDPKLLDNPVLAEIAASKKKTNAQIALKYLLQRGICVIPKSIQPDRIKENLNVFDFELNATEMTKLRAVNVDFRVYRNGDLKDHPEYPFRE